jgi:mycothiol system anti-sigma-R factor
VDCIDSLDKIFEFIDGNITDKDALEEIEEHLQFCRRCYDVVEFERRVQNFVKECLNCDNIPDEICDRANKMLKEFSEF